MLKITFLGAGSTTFVRNILGDCLCSPTLREAEFALYDVDAVRLAESAEIIGLMNETMGGYAAITTYLGRENRREALRGARFVVNAINVGMDYCRAIDIEIPRKYGLQQTIADTLGIGGIMNGLRTISVMQEIAEDVEAVCPDTLFINYTNPMAIVSGFMERYTNVNTVGLCHSVQSCSYWVLKNLGMEDKLPGRRELIAGINHMAWLLEIKDKDGNDLYPEIRRRAKEKNATQKHDDMVRMDFIDKLGYYVTESSDHSAEYNMFYIKSKYPELIDRFNIKVRDEKYMRTQLEERSRQWKQELDELRQKSHEKHERTFEYASYIMEGIAAGTPWAGVDPWLAEPERPVDPVSPYRVACNVINQGGLIENLPADACVEVPCLVDGQGVHPCRVGKLPVQLAAMNMTNINVQLLTIEAAVTRKKEHIYHAAMLDPHTASELDIDTIRKMIDEMMEAYGDWLPAFH